jgi:hypothetical protein
MVPKKRTIKAKFLLEIQAQFSLETILHKKNKDQKNKNKLLNQ